MEGLDNLRETLLGRNREKAEAVLKQARSEAAAVSAKADATIQTLKDENEKRRLAQDEAALKRTAAMAALDGRRIDLKTRQTMVTQVLTTVAKNLESLDESERRSYYTRLLRDHQAPDTTVLLGPQDEAVVRALAEELHYEHKLKVNPGQSAGLIFMEGRVEDDCRFEAVLRARHDELVALAAEILFDSENGEKVSRSDEQR